MYRTGVVQRVIEVWLPLVVKWRFPCKLETSLASVIASYPLRSAAKDG